MAPGLLPRSHPSYSRNSLVRLLGQLGIRDVPEPRSTVAEDLSHWLAWTDAIALASALQPPPGPATPPTPEVAAAETAALADELARLRAALAESLRVPPPGAIDAPDPAGTDFGPWRRHCAASQRRMGERLAPLRSKLREALARRSADGAQLAALDAVLDQGLAHRARQQLATLPGWLERHFRQRRTASAASPAPAPWPADAAATVERLLLAELDLRLQPLIGLLEALEATTARTEPSAPT
jgi:hypothetical protein